MKPSIGQIVHFVSQPDLSEEPVHIPAIITAVWSDSCVNLRLFFDGTNQVSHYGKGQIHDWFTSSTLDTSGTTPNSWNWPEQVE